MDGDSTIKPIYLILGESGSGKTTIVNELCKHYHFKQLESYTTRPPRYHGEEGHIFISPDSYETYDDLRRKYPSRIAETMFDGHFYFATQEQLDVADFYVLDVAGLRILNERCFNPERIRVVRITAPAFTRFFRMLKRGDSICSAVRRLRHDNAVFASFTDDIADFTIENIHLSDSIDDLLGYIISQEESHYEKS